MYRLIALLFLVGCNSGGSGGSSASAVTEKNLFSVWKLKGSNFYLDFSKGSLGVSMPLTFVFASGAKCTCDSIAVGTQSAGNYVYSNCTFVTGSASSNPGCSSFNVSGTYTKTATELTGCSGGSCNTYE